MFFKGSESLANEHPVFKELIEKIDQRLSVFDAAGIARVGDFSSFFGEPSSRISGLFDQLVEYGTLRKIEMVECKKCQNLLASNVYRSRLATENGLECTQCGNNMDEDSPKFLYVYSLTESAAKQVERAKPVRKVEIRHLVILVHGIRTYGSWQDLVKVELEMVPGIKAVPIGYEYLDVIRFWFPFLTREGSVRKILRKLRHAKSLHPHAELSVIAHSFGTYSIFRILQSEADLRFKRIILCGSIVSHDAGWDHVQPRIQEEVVNDCGTQDIWPVSARAFSWFYGATGTFGFRSPAIIDRFHDLGHGGFFTEEFINKYWVPYIVSGEIVSSPWTTTRPTGSWLLSFMASTLFRWLLAGLVLLVCWVAWKLIW